MIYLSLIQDESDSDEFKVKLVEEDKDVMFNYFRVKFAMTMDLVKNYLTMENMISLRKF